MLNTKRNAMALQELQVHEIDHVSGGRPTIGTGFALGGFGLAVVGAVMTGGIGGVVALGGAAIGALAYAYDRYSSYASSSVGYGTGWSYSQSGNSNYSPYGGSAYSSSSDSSSD